MIRHKSSIVPSGPLEVINCTDFCAEAERVAVSRYKLSNEPNIDKNLSVALGPHCLLYLKQPKKGENGANGAYVRYVRYACFCLIPRVFRRGFYFRYISREGPNLGRFRCARRFVPKVAVLLVC